MATTTSSSLDFPCPSTSSFQVLVDDFDLAQIKYSDAGWVTSGARGFECNATTHGSVHTVGTDTTATFSFEGIGVQVYGTIAPNGIPTSTYQLDDLALFTFTFNANTGNTINYRVQYYASPVLEPGNHTLVISSEGLGSSQMFLDYIIYNPIPSYVSDASSGATSTSSASPLFTSSSGPSTSHSAISFSTGALAGGIIGGTILGLLLGILFSLITFWKRKRGNATNGNIFDRERDILTEATDDRASSSVSMPAQSYTQSYNAFSQTPSSTIPVVLSPPVRNRNHYIPDRKNRPPKSSSEPMIVQNGGAGSEMEEEIRSQPPAYVN